MLGVPHVSHEDEFGSLEHLLLCFGLYLIYIGSLAAECLVGSIAPAGVGQLLPRTEDVLGSEQAGCIGIPTGAAARYHPVGTVLLEDSGSFIESACCHTHEGAVVLHVVISELCDVQGEIVLRREYVIGFTVIIHKDRHITCHLATLEVAHEEHPTFYLGVPLRSPPTLILRLCQLLTQVGGVGQGKADRVSAGIDTTRPHEAERTKGGVAYCYSRAGSSITFALHLQMKPHDKLPGACVVEHFGPLDDASTLDVAAWLAAHRQHQPMIGPVFQVLGCEATHAQRTIWFAVGRAALAVPVIGAFVVEDASAVGVDVLARIVVPYSSVHGSLCAHGKQAAGSQEDE